MRVVEVSRACIDRLGKAASCPHKPRSCFGGAIGGVRQDNRSYGPLEGCIGQGGMRMDSPCGVLVARSAFVGVT